MRSSFPSYLAPYVEVLLYLELLPRLHESALEESGLQPQEGLLQLKGSLAHGDLDISTAILGEERLQLFPGIG